MKQSTAIESLKESPSIKLSTIHAFWMDDFFYRVSAMYNSIERRAYEIFESNGKQPGHDLDDWFRAESELLHPVHLEIEDSGQELIVHAEVPGFKADEIEVFVRPRQLTIAGKRERTEEREKKKTIYTERCSNQILRVLNLPVEVDMDKITATLDNGVLQLNMPKAVSAKNVQTLPKAA
jgi:HSP20 family protein